MDVVYIKFNSATNRFTWEPRSDRLDWGNYPSLAKVKSAIRKFFPGRKPRAVVIGLGKYA